MSAEFEYAVSGMVGGVCLVLAGHPFDLIKVQLQSKQAKQNGSLQHWLLNWWRGNRRLARLYQGVLPPLLGAPPLAALTFASYAFGLRLVGAADGEERTTGQAALAGAFSGLVMAFVQSPAERIKILLQNQPLVYGEPGYRGLLHHVKQSWRKGGLGRGLGLTMLRDGYGSAAYFACYEALRKSLFPSLETCWIAGGLAGMLNWTLVFPVDTVKTRLQAGWGTRGREVLAHILRNDGWPALFRGLAPALLRAFPANAACFGGMELTRKLAFSS